MTNRPVITFPAAKFKGDHFFVFALLHHFCRDLRTSNEGTSLRQFLAIGMKEHIAKDGLFPDFRFEQIDIDRIAFRDPILSPASLDNCVSHGREKSLKVTRAGCFDKRKSPRRFARVDEKRDLSLDGMDGIMRQQFQCDPAAKFFELFR